MARTLYRLGERLLIKANIINPLSLLQMKNFTLILALLFVGVSASASSAKVNFPPNNYGEAFIFVEGGVEFAVYPNGEFDFYYNPQFINTSVRHISSPNQNISYNSGYNYDAYIQYDDFGAVLQIENVPVYYDYYGRIIQAGDVIINYNKSGRIVRIGDMHVRYNMFNQPVRYIGHINHYNTRYIARPWHSYYMRPHVSHRVVYYEPYRAYYQPVRMDYYVYNSYYTNNNYYYNKNNFYRPGQQVSDYNYGRRTTTQKELKPALRSSENVTRTAAANDNNTTVRSNSTASRSVESGNIERANVSRERANIEQHESAVRAQRGSANTQAYNTPAQTRSAVNSNVRARSTSPNTTQTRAVERPTRVTRSSAPQVRTTTPQTQQRAAVRASTPERNRNVQPASGNTRSSVRTESSTPRSSEIKPVRQDSRSGQRGNSGIRG